MSRIFFEMSLEFRKAESNDLDHSLSMMQDFYAIDNYPFDREQAKKNFMEFTSSETLGVFWLVLHNSEIIGYLILTFGYSFEYGGRDAFVDELYLKEQYRGRGFGTELLSQLDIQVISLEIRALHLEVEKANETGINLYLKNGFLGKNRSLLTKKITQ
ncbi:MAG: GNAT family N-acetyltransferase [Cyclobacteriaceae bacterium]